MIEWLWGVKFFFHVELWAKNTNPHNCHTPFEIPNKKVLRETLYNTKNPTNLFRLTGRTDFGSFQFDASKLIRVLVFRMFFLAISRVSKEQSDCG